MIFSHRIRIIKQRIISHEKRTPAEKKKYRKKLTMPIIKPSE